jgi:hypothetical protein
MLEDHCQGVEYGLGALCVQAKGTAALQLRALALSLTISGVPEVVA